MEDREIYLVQAMVLKKEFDEKGGVDANFQLSYMGSAEYEFGALPKSLRRICGKLPESEVTVVEEIKNPEGVPLSVFGAGFADDYKNELMELASEKGHGKTKRSSYFTNVVSGTGYGSDKEWFWWDIENDFIFCFGVKNLDKAVMAVQNVAKNKGW